MPILTVAGTDAYTAYAERREALIADCETAYEACRAARKEHRHLTPEARWELVRPLREAREAADAALQANDVAFDAACRAAKAEGVEWFACASDDE